jgi:uncharacterized protein YihD (DUF1040 family)
VRDPSRIDPMLEKLGAIWHQYPDLRLTQLLWALGASSETAPRFFYREDDALSEAMDSWLAGRT